MQVGCFGGEFTMQYTAFLRDKFSSIQHTTLYPNKKIKNVKKCNKTFNKTWMDPQKHLITHGYN